MKYLHPKASIPESYELKMFGRSSDLLQVFSAFPFLLSEQWPLDWKTLQSLQLRDSLGFTPYSLLIPTEVGNHNASKSSIKSDTFQK